MRFYLLKKAVVIACVVIICFLFLFVISLPPIGICMDDSLSSTQTSVW